MRKKYTYESTVTFSDNTTARHVAKYVSCDNAANAFMKKIDAIRKPYIMVCTKEIEVKK